MGGHNSRLSNRWVLQKVVKVTQVFEIIEFYNCFTLAPKDIADIQKFSTLSEDEILKWYESFR